MSDTKTKTIANPEIRDVKAAYLAVTAASPTRKYFSCDTQPCNVLGMVKSHFKGISAYSDKLIFSHTNLGLILNPPHGMYLLADQFPYSNAGATVGLFSTNESHPCSSQACGAFMALGQQASADSTSSEIQIYDVSPTEFNLEAKLLGVIPRPGDGINGVAITKDGDMNGGRYLVAGLNGQNLTIYRSESSSLEGIFPTFTSVFSDSNFNASGAGLALITQTDGKIFMISMNADDNGENSLMDLYLLDLESQPATCKSVLLTPTSMPIPGMSDSVSSLDNWSILNKAENPLLAIFVTEAGPSTLNSSFRWGKGLAITPNGNFIVYASDRNALPYAATPDDSAKNNFSVVQWTIEAQNADHLVPGTGMSVSPAAVVFNSQIYAFHQGEGNCGELW